jgi:hypothetical protein
VDRDDLWAFAHRDWAAVERGKQQYWADRYRREGSGPARHASALLLEHAYRLGVDFLSDAHRGADLAHHVELGDRLDRATRALARR